MSIHKGWMMIFAKQARLGHSWENNVRVCASGEKISRVETGVSAQSGDVCVDTLLPALANLHSHSFQRAMAGMTEYRQAGKDNFWTWRELMYRFMDCLTPQQIQAFAALTFMEMQEAGFASVGEFHYVHHRPGGANYENISELSQRIFAGASKTGIGLTHLPVLYSYGGAGMTELKGGQLRFGNDLESFEQLFSSIQTDLKHMPADTKIGIAPHSLRAISPADLTRLTENHSSLPFHIHVAEQPQEVRDVISWLGARPVEWVLDNANVNRDWCLIHTTHMTENETKGLAATGAVAGLCPITEANLGDGVFNGVTFLKAGGTFGIGSDSNIRISMTEELRMLEYSQRSRDLARNVIAPKDGSIGDALYLGAAKGGAQALGRGAGTIETGQLADLVAIDSNAVSLCALPPEKLLDGLCFASSDNVVTDLWSGGRHSVKNGTHIARTEIVKKYRQAISELVEAI